MLLDAARTGFPYDVALLDMQMPEMDGLTLARNIKGNPTIAATRLVVLTSLGQMMTSDELKTLGIDIYLVKPVKQSRLYDSLVTICGQLDPARFGDKAKPVQHKAPAEKSSFPKPTREALILLAEDNNINQKVALGQLRKLGYGADVVSNGIEAIQALQKISYDIIFMDCQMPEMNGYEASLAIRKAEQDQAHPCPWKSPVRIIAMTATAMQGDREKCLEAGMDDYISKPAQVGDIQAALERWEKTIINRTAPGGHPQ